jgi:hypothetical protein
LAIGQVSGRARGQDSPFYTGNRRCGVRSSLRLLSGFVQLDRLLGSPESNEAGIQAHVAGAGVVLRLVTFPFAPGQFLAQLPQPFVHTGILLNPSLALLGKGLPK